MMPFSLMAKRAVDKVLALDVKMIAPSHGPIYSNPQNILPKYRAWTNGETKEKVLILYATMWNATREMANESAGVLMNAGIETYIFDLATADIGEVAKHLVDSRAIVFGSPTFLSNAHPVVLNAMMITKMLRSPVKYAIFLNPYGWGTASGPVSELLKDAKIELVGKVECNWVAKEDHIKATRELTNLLIEKIKNG
jgi:flavorubredoxin